MRSLASSATLVREIRLFDAVTLVVGSMIGSGIFIVSAQSLRILGSPGWLLATWATAGLLTIIGAICSAPLAVTLPKAGGPYVFLREAFGPLMGFLFGWTLFLVIQSGTIAAVGVAFASFLGVLLPGLSGPAPVVALGSVKISSAQLVAVMVVLGLTFTNATGLRTGTMTQNVLTVIKVAALLGLTVLGLTLGGGPHAALRTDRFWHAVTQQGSALTGVALVGAMVTAMVGPLFSQSAWTNLTFAGEEVARPEHTFPRALVLGCLLVSTLYVLANIAYLNVLSVPEIQRAPADRVAVAVSQSLLGGAGGVAVAVAIMISTFGCLNGLILSGARVYFAMARDGLFFRGLGQLNSAAVPGRALWTQAVWSALLALSGTYSDLLKYVISMDLVFYGLLVSTVFVLRRRWPQLVHLFPGASYPSLPILYVLLVSVVAVILAIRNPATALPGYLLVLTGFPAYVFWKRRSRRLQPSV